MTINRLTRKAQGAVVAAQEPATANSQAESWIPSAAAYGWPREIRR